MHPFIYDMLVRRFGVDEDRLVIDQLEEPWACGSIVHDQHIWGHRDGPVDHFYDAPCGTTLLICSGSAAEIRALQVERPNNIHICASGCGARHTIKEIIVTPTGGLT